MPAPRHHQRGSAALALYRTREWQDLRRDQLEKQPLCEECLKTGRTTPATIAHHEKPHRNDRELFFDPDNLASSCKPCHDGALQVQERSGYLPGCDVDGRPLDPAHPWNRQART
jgi:hypothetical protein